MRAPNHEASPSGVESAPVPETRYEPPRYELICLACEISSYAPDGDWPLL